MEVSAMFENEIEEANRRIEKELRQMRSCKNRTLAEQLNKTSISVPEMGKLLGMGKTNSYYLIRNNYFEVKEVNGRMRVMLDSFEKWYSSQSHYKKAGERGNDHTKHGIHRKEKK